MSFHHLGREWEDMRGCPPEIINNQIRELMASLRPNLERMMPLGETPMSDSEELLQDQDRIEAYRQLKDRCDKLGYASVNHALDELERFLND